jgi:hypothetical protein
MSKHTYRLESQATHTVLALIQAYSPEDAVEEYAVLRGFDDAYDYACAMQTKETGCEVIEIIVL